MDKTTDKLESIKLLPPVWEVGGRYGYSMVDEYRPGDEGRGTYGSLGPFKNRKQAAEVASALNAAYRRGREDR